MKKITVIGGAAADLKAFSPNKLQPGTSNIGSFSESLGGVAFNIARNLALLKEEIFFISTAGNDTYGKLIQDECKKLNISFCNIPSKKPTAVYNAIFTNEGELFAGISAMDIFDSITPEKIKNLEPEFKKSKMVICDTNISEKTLETVALICNQNNIPFSADPTEKDKSYKLKKILPYTDYIFPNEEELEELANIKITNPDDKIKAGKKLIASGCKNVIVTCGEEGALFISQNETISKKSPKILPRDITGAGDALLACFLKSILDGESNTSALKAGIASAIATIKVYESVNKDISMKLIKKYKEDFSDEI